MNQLEQAFVASAIDGGAPARTYHVGPDALVELANGRNPFDGITVTAWELSDIAAGRNE